MGLCNCGGHGPAEDKPNPTGTWKYTAEVRLLPARQFQYAATMYQFNMMMGQFSSGLFCRR
jgi:hypothetical protein